MKARTLLAFLAVFVAVLLAVRLVVGRLNSHRTVEAAEGAETATSLSEPLLDWVAAAAVA